MTQPLLIAIPMKDPARAKTRLTGHLSSEERSDLAHALYLHTLQQIQVPGVQVLVVSESDRVLYDARKHGAETLKEQSSQGLNAACRRAETWATERNYPRMAILPADLALLSSNDVTELVAQRVTKKDVFLCEASDGGTNCMMFTPGAGMTFLYGRNSFQAHRRFAMANELVCHVVRSSGLRFDVDTSEDLAELRREGLISL